MKTILSPNYTAAFTAAFPGDDSRDLKPRQTPGVLWSATRPTPVAAPKLLTWSEDLGKKLGISRPQNEEEISVLGGNALAPGMKPYAGCYGGHQFGNWAGQLGDGRAIALGEWKKPDGTTEELQLKGAGPTPYSRRGDGRAVLRSSVREYLMSEAMYHLGIPTTRALSLVSTGDDVIRDILYNGNARPELGAIVLRTAPSFLRFGHFELLYSRGETELLKQLTDWVIARHYPQFQNEENAVVRLFEEIVKRTAFLIADWLRVGFVHGVMNTDNMSILGLTIDYGPYAMLDAYDTAFTPNTTDLPGRRYAFGQQPQVAKWNLARLAMSLSPLAEVEALDAALQSFDAHFSGAYEMMMLAKMGIGSKDEKSLLLAETLGELLQTLKPDYTLFFQQLETLSLEGDEADDAAHFASALYKEPKAETTTLLHRFLAGYRQVIAEGNPQERTALMQRTNPRFILRNYQLHEAIEALERGGEAPLGKLGVALQTPYENRFPELAQKQPDWAVSKPGCGMLSCSS